MSKLLSARFWMAVMMTGAGCYAMVKQVEVHPTFWVLWGIIIRDYFARSDR